MNTLEKAFLSATTDQFKLLEIDSRGRNRGPSSQLVDLLDPDGVHMIANRFVHNDREYRCTWMCKIKDKKEPVIVMMDNDIAKVAALTSEVIYKDEDVQDEEMNIGFLKNLIDELNLTQKGKLQAKQAIDELMSRVVLGENS